MRREVYERKAKEAFAHRKRHDKSQGTLRGPTTQKVSPPTSSVIKPESKLEKWARFTKGFLALVAVLAAVAIIGILIINAGDYTFGWNIK